jgi:diguanylate cyclase (GGDEF)-like protein/PAS domain S-box-containing protein
MQDMNEEEYIYDKRAFHEFRRVYKLINHSVLYTTSDLNGNITSVSKAFEILSGYQESELLGKNHNLFRDKDTPDEFYKQMWHTLNMNERFVGEVKNITKHNLEYWLRLIIEPIYDETKNKIGYASYRENVTHTKKLEYISTHDTLTDIFNREHFNIMLDEHIQKSKRHNDQFALIILDIDLFKNINDTYGHIFGDTVLFKIAQLLKNNIRTDDIVSRWGGEEFALLINFDEKKGATILAQKLKGLIENMDFNIKDKITASFGVGIYKDDETKIEFFERIDEALYTAKKSGRNLVIEAD